MIDLKRRSILFSKKEKLLKSLPWAINKNDFYDLCSRCGKCSTACKNNIIAKDKYGYPYIDFFQGVGECNFCHHCVDICPSPIFNSIETSPWNEKIEISLDCLSLNNIECRSCSDICGFRVIKFIPMLSGFNIQINKEHCTSCGACISLCPVNAIKI